MATVATKTVDTANALQAINAAVAGVATAPPVANYPTALDTPSLPLVLSWPSDGRWYSKGGAAGQEVRTWLILCYVEPLGQGDIPTNAQAAMNLMDRMIQTYLNVANVSLAQLSPQITIESGPDMQHSDGGIVPDLSFGGRPFHGFRLRINVRALW